MPDGRGAITLEPLELLRKLATLVPPPRKHLVRYHGVFAPHSALRKLVVAGAHAADAPAAPASLLPEAQPPPRPAEATPAPPLAGPAPNAPGAASRIPWAELLARVFKEDVLACQRCGGRMRVIAFVKERAAIKKVLAHLGLPATGPPARPARGSGDPEPEARHDGENHRDELPDYDA